MGTEKRYYWLKLKEDFFRQKEIKKLRKIAGGDTYSIIYLKMLLKSLSNNGVLFFDGVENNFIEELALDIDENEENVAVTVRFLMSQNILVEMNEDEYRLTTCADMVGSETRNAERVRRYRKKQETLQSNVTPLQCNTDVTSCNTCVITCNTEIDIEKDIEKEKEKEDSVESPPPKITKHKYGEYKNVLLTDEELQKLKTEYSDYEERIERLSSYVASTGKKYKSHYATIRNWARKDKESGKKEIVPSWMNKKRYQQQNYDFEALEEDVLANAPTVKTDPALAERAEALKRRFENG